MSLELEEILLQQRFLEAIATEDMLQIKEFLNHQNISDVAELIYENEEYETQIISHLSIHRAVGVFKILELPVQKRIIKELPAFTTAELLNELPADDRTSFFSELSSNVVRELLKTLNPEERKITLSLLGYPEDSVGRLMTPDYVYVYENNTVEEVLNSIRQQAKSSETIDVIYVINDKGELLEDIRIKDFILASPEKKVNELMDGRFIALHAEDDQEVANVGFYDTVRRSTGRGWFSTASPEARRGAGNGVGASCNGRRPIRQSRPYALGHAHWPPQCRFPYPADWGLVSAFCTLGATTDR